jgi:A/G-specific adenine glycosylase
VSSAPEGSDSPAEALGEVAEIQEALTAWYATDHREFPWRQTTDPYEILVSEVMSQQTQLERVITPWREFLDEWPTLEALAEAERADVVGFWTAHALGYNNRARYLHEAARQVRDEYDGVFPERPAELQELMGVGPYTANAVASFAFNAGDAVVDTNVRRVLYRLAGLESDCEERRYRRLATTVMPEDRSRVWNNAIMELGGLVCERTPRCEEEGCPLRDQCAAYRTGDFGAPEIQGQPSFEGSRRQMRGRIVRILGESGEVTLPALGPRVRVDYGGEHGEQWLRGLLDDLAADGLVAVDTDCSPPVARLRR